jgi:type VI secretion system protein ImpA
LLDIDALARPIDDAEPAGPDLEYSAVAELERFAAGTPGTVDPKTNELVGAEEPNWRKVGEMATELLGKTKDLRVAAWLARAELANRGLTGLAEGLKLVSTLLENFWPTLYPPLDATENDNPIDRINVLANLSPDAESYGSAPTEALLRALRGAAIAESREVGRYTVRDLEYSLGRMQPPAGTAAPTPELLAAAWRRGDAEANREKREGIAIGLAAIQAIGALFQEKSGERPNLDLLQSTLRRVGEFYAAQDAANAGIDGDAEGDAGMAAEGDGGAPAAGGGKTPRSGGLASRADAVRILQQVAEFLRKSEPSSPAPMFVDRAIKLLQMDFTAIVKELMPDSKDRIEMLGGISLEDPEDD